MCSVCSALLAQGGHSQTAEVHRHHHGRRGDDLQVTNIYSSYRSEQKTFRCKPFKYTYEKEIVMYAYFKKLDYFSTECIYSPNAYR